LSVWTLARQWIDLQAIFLAAVLAVARQGNVVVAAFFSSTRSLAQPGSFPLGGSSIHKADVDRRFSNPQASTLPVTVNWVLTGRGSGGRYAGQDDVGCLEEVLGWPRANVCSPVQ